MSYNGWTNYETWCVKLWMDNDDSSYRYWQRIVALCATDGTDETRNLLAKELKQWHEEALPELTGFASDLLNAAMGEVNWYEIAESLLRDHAEEEGA